MLINRNLFRTEIKSSFYFPLRITLLYLILGGLWILFSDKLAVAFTNDFETLAVIQMYKGWFFIIITAFFFYLLIKRDFKLIETTQKELSESEKRFRSLFDNAPLGYQAVDSDGKILAVNKAVCSTLGYTEKEMVGKYFVDFLKVEDKSIFEEILKNIQSDGVLGNVEFRMVKKDKATAIIAVEGKVAFTNDGQFKQLHCILIDITERKKNEADLIKLSSAVDQSPAAVAILKRDGKLEYINPKFTQLTGYTFNETAGKEPIQLKPSSMPDEEFKNIWSSIKAGDEWSGEYYNNKKNGEFYWELISISPIKNTETEITHFLVLKEDITGRKTIEKELIRAKDEAEELSKLKTNLLGNISHELRTPLVGIIGFAEFLKETELDVDQSDMVQKIINSSKRLTNTLNSILYLSEIASRENYLNKEEINLAKHTPMLMFPFIQAAKEKGLEFSILIKSKKASAVIDDKLYIMVLNNLLDNALKFTRHGKIEITIDLVETGENKFAAVKVSDTGIGIAETDREKIFQEFRQASEGVSRWYEGTGLGLTLAKKMVEAMDGTINLESEIGKGSIFTIMFPAIEIPEATEEIADDVSKESGIQPFRILLVEDNFINKEVTELYLKDIYSIDHAENGEAAVELSRQNHYDVILMDINLGGGINGIETAKEIRKLNGYESVPVVAVTGYAMAGDKEVLLAEGLTHYLAKPFEKQELLQLLAEILIEN
ncbi:MAG: PAS domain S-box protein [Ignavibacteriales bacterium]|nr:MAG: PAS domain S-box protein [Ignavibacteriales bacterium]